MFIYYKTHFNSAAMLSIYIKLFYIFHSVSFCDKILKIKCTYYKCNLFVKGVISLMLIE